MKGNLKILALKYLKENQQLSGSEIQDKIEEGTNWKPSPGTLYPSLEKLEEDGLAKSQKEGRKRVYQITDKGENRLEEFQSEQEEYWGQIIQSLRNYSEMFNEEELEDMIKVLEQAKKGQYEKSYPEMAAYRIIDLLANYEELEKEKQEKINQEMKQTLETIEEETQ